MIFWGPLLAWLQLTTLLLLLALLLLARTQEAEEHPPQDVQEMSSKAKATEQPESAVAKQKAEHRAPSLSRRAADFPAMMPFRHDSFVCLAHVVPSRVFICLL